MVLVFVGAGGAAATSNTFRGTDNGTSLGTATVSLYSSYQAKITRGTTKFCLAADVYYVAPTSGAPKQIYYGALKCGTTSALSPKASQKISGKRGWIVEVVNGVRRQSYVSPWYAP